VSWRRGIELGLAALLALLLGLDLAWPPPLPKDDGRALVVLAADGRTPLRAWPGADGAWRQPDHDAGRGLAALSAGAARFRGPGYFRWHPGVNPFALLRAGWQWAASGRMVSGGSTLTMQVARILEPTGRSTGRAPKLRQVAAGAAA
jgi:penicillin-binding protein 1C